MYLFLQERNTRTKVDNIRIEARTKYNEPIQVLFGRLLPVRIFKLNVIASLGEKKIAESEMRPPTVGKFLKHNSRIRKQ